MTDQRARRGSEGGGGAGGYRGALPPRNDSLARGWVVAVLVIFVLMFALAFAGFPSSLFPTPTPTPSPTATATPVPSASPSVAPSSLSTP